MVKEWYAKIEGHAPGFTRTVVISSLGTMLVLVVYRIMLYIQSIDPEINQKAAEQIGVLMMVSLITYYVMGFHRSLKHSNKRLANLASAVMTGIAICVMVKQIL